MALIVSHVIAYIQILSAGYNLWGVDPRMLIDMPLGRNTFMVVLFIAVHLLGLAGAILIIQDRRLGYVRLGYMLSIAHHMLLVPALVMTGMGLVMLMDDRINLTLLFMSKPSGGDIGLYWSLGWKTVFQQVTSNVPTGSTYFGINLFAFACATQLWIGMDEIEAEKIRQSMQMRRRERRSTPPQGGQSEQHHHSYEQHARPQQGVRQPRHPPPNWDL